MKFKTFAIIVSLIGIPSIVEAQGMSCPSVYGDSGAYKNYQSGRNLADSNTIKQDKSWQGYLDKYGQPDWVKQNAQGWQNVHEYKAGTSDRSYQYGTGRSGSVNSGGGKK
mgnify:CR=1 FL=1